MTLVAEVVDQLRVDAWPAVMMLGDAVKLAMTGWVGGGELADPTVKYSLAVHLLFEES